MVGYIAGKNLQSQNINQYLEESIFRSGLKNIMSSSTTDWKNNTSAMAWALRVREGSIIHRCAVKIVDRSEHEHVSSEDSLFSGSHIEKSQSSMPGWGGGDELDFPTHHASEYSAGGGREDDFVVFADVCSVAVDQAASRSITCKLKVGEQVVDAAMGILGTRPSPPSEAQRASTSIGT